MGWIGETVDSVKSLQIRQVLTQAVSLGSFFFSSLFFSFNFSFNKPSISRSYTPKSFQFQLLRSNSPLPTFLGFFSSTPVANFFTVSICNSITRAWMSSLFTLGFIFSGFHSHCHTARL